MKVCLEGIGCRPDLSGKKRKEVRVEVEVVVIYRWDVMNTSMFRCSQIV
jgi:hypothetical protein